MMRYLQRLAHAPTTYPLGTFWLGAMVIVPAAVAGWLDLAQCLIILTLLAMTLIVVAAHRDTLALRADVERVHVDVMKGIQQLGRPRRRH